MATSRADPRGRAAEGVSRLRSEPRTAVVHLNALVAARGDGARARTRARTRHRPRAATWRRRAVGTRSWSRRSRATAAPAPRCSVPRPRTRSSPRSTPPSTRSPPTRRAAVLAVAVLGPDALTRRVLALSGADERAVAEADRRRGPGAGRSHARVRPPHLRAHRVRPRARSHSVRAAPRSRRAPAGAARGRAPPRRQRRGHRPRRRPCACAPPPTTRSHAAHGPRRLATTRRRWRIRSRRASWPSSTGVRV